MTDPTLDLDAFCGTWRIVSSTFPMWTRGSRTGPRFTYAWLSPAADGAPRLADNVTYEVRGRTRSIKGVDTLRTGATGPEFRWRGSGLLAPLTSIWRVAELGAYDTWAVIVFSRSLLTPAEVDVVVRPKAIADPEVLDAARERSRTLGARWIL
ncbi:hypothetical protein [Streptomyces sp. NPDC090021]|uniref:hypothetical protein n=1 Tax=Streptomyces sp. NPDC090021 TaxID=3365919 RepID=UPI0037FABEA7